MFYHLPVPIGILLFFLPLILHRKQVYRAWTDRERSEGRNPNLFRFSTIANKDADGRPINAHSKLWAIQLGWAVLMFFPFHLL